MSIQNFGKIEEAIYAELVRQSQLPTRFVRNSLSIYGEDLDKLLLNQVYNSIEHDTDNLILFELSPSQNGHRLSETVGSNLEYSLSFSVYVIIYGDTSFDLATKMIARFRSQAVRDSLQEKDICINEVSHPNMLNEYKNETMWLRTDFEISISCKFIIQNVTEQYEMQLNDIIINGGN